jgi:predicted KAP-like P-loop ATPase
MWTDNETSRDLLGFRVHSDLIRSVVTDPNLLPVTLGVFADWGGGKTSLMKMLQESLEPEHWTEGSPEKQQCERIACLYFNGWLFEGYDDAKSAILSSVLTALGEHKRFGPKLRDGCVSLLKSVNWMRVAHLGLKHVALPAIAAFATGGASLVPSFITSMGNLLPGSNSTKEPQPDTPPSKGKDKEKGADIDWESLIKKDATPAGPLEVRAFREKFAALLKDSNIDSLVVLIDDLDRCSPERIIENLEAIKLFLNVERTAFVIGADPRIVRHAIAWKYKDNKDSLEDEAPTVVTDYLEKLIQLPYRLPRLSPAEIETYMALLFCQSHLTADGFTKAVSACDSQRSANRFNVFGYSAVNAAVNEKGQCPLPDALDKALTFSAGAAPLITEGLKGNPRQVKRFLNAFVLRKKLAQVAQLTNIRDDVLVKLMILEYSQEKRFRQLYEWQAAQSGIPHQLSDFEKALDEQQAGEKPELPDDWNTPSLQRWVKMAPALGGVDLRDYFWIARDRLQSSMSGISMVPPVVRRIFEQLVSGSVPEKSTAAKTARDFEESDRDTLFDLLDRNLKQHPTTKAAYDAYRLMIEAGVANAATRYATALDGAPPSQIPPAVGTDIGTLVKSKPELTASFSPVIAKLSKTDTQVGRALAALAKAGKK